MANEKTRLGAADLDYLIFDLAARCKESGATITMQRCLMGLQELQERRDPSWRTKETIERLEKLSPTVRPSQS